MEWVKGPGVAFVSTLGPDPASSLPRCPSVGLGWPVSGKQEIPGVCLRNQWCHPQQTLGGGLLVWKERGPVKQWAGAPPSQVIAAFFLTFHLSSLCFPFYSLSCKKYVLDVSFPLDWIQVSEVILQLTGETFSSLGLHGYKPGPFT